ncbi:MAG: hypothetical protein ACRD3W_26690 [Terriglobales bacterium]
MILFDAWIFGITLVGGAVLFASLGVLLVRKRVATGRLKGHHEVAGYLLSIVGTLYSVLLGLVVVDTQAKYQEAKMMTQKEADACLDLFHLAYTTPMVTRHRLHKALQEYLRIVVEDEYDSVLKLGTFDESAKQPFREIWWTLCDYEPQTGKEQSAYQKILDVMEEFTDGRRYRLQIIKQGLPLVTWGVLIAGGILTVFFTYMFEVENVKAQVLMTSLVVLALSLNLLLIALFNNPYRGHMRIQSYAFKYDLNVTKELLTARPDD